MKYIRLSGFMLMILAVSIFTSCSGGRNPVEMKSPESEGLPDSIGVDVSDGVSNRSALAVYDAVIDPDAKTFTVFPSERTADYHFPLTQLYPNVLQIVDYGWTPNFWADIKLTHPLPGSGIDAFDPRVIAILPANPGVSFFYPIFNCVGNNKVVLEPDGYTKLFDNLGSSIPGNTNPFLAYFRHVEYRRWFSSGTGMMSDTRRWELDINGFGGPIQFKLVVDVSTNYPNPPQQVIDNAPEPVDIKTIIEDGLTSGGGSAQIEVTFLDWQGSDNITCKVESPELFDNAIQLFYEAPGPNPNEYIFSGSISNSLLAPAGEYNILITAWDIPTDIHVFNEVKVNVVGIPDNPEEVTPPWLNFSPRDIHIDGNNAYIAGFDQDLHVFDITDPQNPAWVKQVETNRAEFIHVSNGYAYISSTDSGLQIIDIDPLDSSHHVKDIPVYVDYYRDIHISGDYAYVLYEDEDDVSGDDYSGVIIIDINPPESAAVVKIVSWPVNYNSAYGVYVENGYAYIAASSDLKIIDVDPPDLAHTIKSLDSSAESRCVFVMGDYAYVGDLSGLSIIDINPPESAYVVKVVEKWGLSLSKGVFVSDGFAYVLHDNNGLMIVDVDPPESAYILKEITTPASYLEGIHVANGCAYMVYDYGIQVIDVDPPESASIVNTIDTPIFAKDICVSDGFGYVANGHAGLQIMDIEPFSSLRVLKTFDTSSQQPHVPSDARSIDTSNGYAYIADRYHGLQIIDIEPASSVHIVKTIEIPGLGSANDVDVSGDYAYVVDGMYGSGLYIIDINPPESAYIVNTVNTTDEPYFVYISNGFAFVSCSGLEFDGLEIIDIDPPETAYSVKTIELFSPGDLYVIDGYAYVPDYHLGLRIIDIDPPETAYIVKSVITSDDSRGVCVSNGYAYLTGIGFYSGFHVIDVDPPDQAYIVKDIDIQGDGQRLDVYGGYAYIASSWTFGGHGMRIIKLW